MITSSSPQSWQELQEDTARILDECGFSVEIERTVETARGNVELDVYAEEHVDGRRYTIVCECKHWRRRIPQAVVLGFRTVIGDIGANLGLVVASKGFQLGAKAAAKLTNVRLVTWTEFQADFECSWLTNYLYPTVAARCDPLLTYTEPLLPQWFVGLTPDQRARYAGLKRQYDEFGRIMIAFTPYMRMLHPTAVPKLPLRAHVATAAGSESVVPDAILDATGYREFLDAALAHSDFVVQQFRELRPLAEPPSEYE